MKLLVVILSLMSSLLSFEVSGMTYRSSLDFAFLLIDDNPKLTAYEREKISQIDKAMGESCDRQASREIELVVIIIGVSPDHDLTKTGRQAAEKKVAAIATELSSVAGFSRDRIYTTLEEPNRARFSDFERLHKTRSSPSRFVLIGLVCGKPYP
jgi:hypothetical protein